MRGKSLKLWYCILGLLACEFVVYLLAGLIFGYYQKNIWAEFSRYMVNPKPAEHVPYQNQINLYGEKAGVSPQLIEAVIEAESSFNPRAVSKTGAAGLMQIMPGTWKTVNRELQLCRGRHTGECSSACYFDPDRNIQIGSFYLAGLVKQFKPDIRSALAAYNAGPAAVERYGGVPPYPETREYVRRIVDNWQKRQPTDRQREYEICSISGTVRAASGWSLLTTAGSGFIYAVFLVRRNRSWRWR